MAREKCSSRWLRLVEPLDNRGKRGGNLLIEAGLLRLKLEHPPDAVAQLLVVRVTAAALTQRQPVAREPGSAAAGQAEITSGLRRGF